MKFKDLNGKSIQQAFMEFDQENPKVYQLFRQQALRAIKEGVGKISSKNIIHWLRWEVPLNTTDKNFKINDAFTAHYARKFINEFPKYRGLIEMRKLRSQERAPYMDMDDQGQITFY